MLSDVIEEVVSGDSMRDWWNHGVHAKCPSTYYFLVKRNIPQRIVRPRKWQNNIHEMLRRFPTISSKCVASYFDSVDNKLSINERLEDAPMLLERSMWKSKITNQFDRNMTPSTMK